uniref:Uncharacterized protein n=1 Tax=Arundo donax TaxID=35708 RepID=A0A0A9C8P2_ARUDO
MQEDMPLLRKISSLRVPAISPMLLGRQPSNRGRFASTITDAVELLKLSGSVNSKWLLLMNSASIFLSKIAAGTLPQKLLNLMSTYWTLGRQRSWEGKPPESWLLLTSISWRRWRERRDSGREPEKWLELRWKTARSERRPSSSGSVPARSPWLRSTPATVRWHGSSGAGAQYTPK